jgi:hypothetical protein
MICCSKKSVDRLTKLLQQRGRCFFLSFAYTLFVSLDFLENMKGSSAFSIAIKSLRSCYGQLGIYAGGTHFYDLWARDHCFSSWGALFIGDHVVVKKGTGVASDFCEKRRTNVFADRRFTHRADHSVYGDSLSGK